VRHVSLLIHPLRKHNSTEMQQTAAICQARLTASLNRQPQDRCLYEHFGARASGIEFAKSF